MTTSYVEIVTLHNKPAACGRSYGEIMPSRDRFSSLVSGPNAPALASHVITPSDDTDLPEVIRAVTIATAGTLSWRGEDGETYTTAQLPAGTYALRTRRIRATGTSAAQITGWV